MPLWFWLAFGAVTGLICALSGAGGPILVMPLLVVFGVPVKTAVGIALFNSILLRSHPVSDMPWDAGLGIFFCFCL